MKQLRLLWLARNVFVSRLEEQDQDLEIQRWEMVGTDVVAVVSGGWQSACGHAG